LDFEFLLYFLVLTERLYPALRSRATIFPLISSSTRATSLRSDADAVILTVPLTLAPFFGALVTFGVGRVLSTITLLLHAWKADRAEPS